MPILDEDPENSVVPASDPLKNKRIIFLVKNIVKSIFQPTKCNQNINFFYFHKEKTGKFCSSSIFDYDPKNKYIFSQKFHEINFQIPKSKQNKKLLTS